jgi:hypothetical protein
LVASGGAGSAVAPQQHLEDVLATHLRQPPLGNAPRRGHGVQRLAGQALQIVALPAPGVGCRFAGFRLGADVGGCSAGGGSGAAGIRLRRSAATVALAASMAEVIDERRIRTWRKVPTRSGA